MAFVKYSGSKISFIENHAVKSLGLVLRTYLCTEQSLSSRTFQGDDGKRVIPEKENRDKNIRTSHILSQIMLSNARYEFESAFLPTVYTNI